MTDPDETTRIEGHLERNAEEIRAVIVALREVYSWLHVARRNLTIAWHSTKTGPSLVHFTCAMNQIGFCMGALDLLIHDLEKGTRPFRDYLVRAPAVMGETGSEIPKGGE